MVELDLPPLHRDAAPRVARLLGHDQGCAGCAVDVLDMVAGQASRTTAVHHRGTTEFIKRRVGDVEFAAMVFDGSTAIEQGTGFETDLLTSVCEAIAAVQIDSGIRDRGVFKVVQPRTAMNFVTMAKPMDVELPVDCVWRLTGDGGRIAGTAGADHLNILKSRDIT